MIDVLTYAAPHRKSYDVLSLLKARGYKDVTVYAAPHHYGKSFFPLYEHRAPVTAFTPDTKVICQNFDYSYNEGHLEQFQIPSEDIILICGAGILQEEFVNSHKIINAHPGYIPNCRGLDALKWAIYEGQPIGVTTHLVGEYVDAGEVIERKTTPVYYNDTFHAVAQRVYEMEIGMLVDAIEKIEQPHEFIEPGNYPVHKRMPHSYEMRLLDRFHEIVKKIPIEQ